MVSFNTVEYLGSGGVDSQLDQAVGVSPFVVIPRDDLVEVVVEEDAGFGIDGGGGLVVNEIRGHELFLGVSKNSFHWALGGFLESSKDIFLGGGLFSSEGQIDDGDIGGWDLFLEEKNEKKIRRMFFRENRRRQTRFCNTMLGTYSNSHTGQLSVELGKDDSDSLGSSGGGRNRVVQSTTSSTPVLSSLGRSIDNQLVGSSSMNGGHESLNDAKLVVQDLGKRSKTVSGTGGVGEDGLALVLVVVDSHNEHGSIGRGSRDDDLLSSSFQVQGSLLDGLEDSGGFANNLGSDFTPFDLGGVTFGEELDSGSIDDEAVSVNLDRSGVSSMNRIILELVGSIVDRQERIVDSDNSGIGIFDGSTAHKTSDASKSVDSESSRHGEKREVVFEVVLNENYKAVRMLAF